MVDCPSETNHVAESATSLMPLLFLSSSHAPATPIAWNTNLAPVCRPPCPALTSSAAATLSGNGSSASTTRVRRSTMMKSTPRIPPTSMMAVLSQ